MAIAQPWKGELTIVELAGSGRTVFALGKTQGAVNVERKRQTLPAAHINGGVQMRRLALEALDALERASLGDAAQQLQERLFTRDPAALVERDEQNSESWRFKPMAELLLLELTRVATADDVPPDERRNRIQWAMDMSGF